MRLERRGASRRCAAQGCSYSHSGAVQNRTLQRDLPFSAKPKIMKPRSSNKPTLEQRRAVIAERGKQLRYRPRTVLE